MKAHKAIRSLYENASDHMSADELHEIGEALTDEAGDMAFRAADVMEGIACLVSNDGTQESQSGNFRTAESVFNLLCMVSQQFNTIGALVEVGAEAKWQAAHSRSKA